MVVALFGCVVWGDLADATVVEGLTVVVVEVVVVVVVVGTVGTFGVTATLLRSLLSVPFFATIQQRENTVGISVMIISTRSRNLYVTSLRLKLITLMTGFLKVSAASESWSSMSSFF